MKQFYELAIITILAIIPHAASGMQMTRYQKLTPSNYTGSKRLAHNEMEPIEMQEPLQPTALLLKEGTIALLEQKVHQEQQLLEQLTITLAAQRIQLEKDQAELFRKKMLVLGFTQMPYYWTKFCTNLIVMESIATMKHGGILVINTVSDFVLGIGTILFTQEQCPQDQQ